MWGAQVRVVVQPLPPQPAYASSARNSIRSRAWGAAADGCSYRVCDQLPRTMAGLLRCARGRAARLSIEVVMLTAKALRDGKGTHLAIMGPAPMRPELAWSAQPVACRSYMVHVTGLPHPTPFAMRAEDPRVMCGVHARRWSAAAWWRATAR